MTKLNNYSELLSYLWVVLCLVGVSGIYMHYKLLTYLKKNHFAKWQELGSPSIFMNNSISNNIRILKFLGRKEYAEIRDDNLISLCKFLNLYTILFLLIFLITLTLFVTTLSNQ